MSEIQTDLIAVLRQTAQDLRRDMPEIASRIDQLADQVPQPCVVAVVGRMNAGKSTFVNAFLGEDLACVGGTETTATINYFRYGQSDPEKPVRCHWRTGAITEETLAFLNSLQGNSAEVLQKSRSIAHLEYWLSNPTLQEVTLVDTPGMAAVVAEHQDLTDAFMLDKQRAEVETEQVHGEADAVIYLIGDIARETDRAFLEEFQQLSGGKVHARNAIGIMAKVDKLGEDIGRRHEYASKAAQQLNESLNTVMPVSAGLARALTALTADGAAGMRRLIDVARRIPAEDWEDMLASDQYYLADLPGCPVSPQERAAVLGKLQWGVFTAIGRIASDPALSVEEVTTKLMEIAGMEPLKQTLQRRFFQRGRMLRSYRIVSDALRLLAGLTFKELRELKQHDANTKRDYTRYLNFILEAGGDPQVRSELEGFFRTHLRLEGRAERLEMLLRDGKRQMSLLQKTLEADHVDAEALQVLQDHRSLFSDGEYGELCALFGLYGREAEARLPAEGSTQAYITDRGLKWSVEAQKSSSVRREVAGSACSRYEALLGDCLKLLSPA